MRVLQITSDWKWTGPASPMLELLLAQRARGHRVELACPEPPRGAPASLADRARAEGADPVLELTRGRGARVWRDRADVRRLAALLDAGRFDVVHAWHSRDHLLALRARRRAPAARETRIVRSYPRAEAISARPWNRWLFGPGSDGLLCVSPATARDNARLRGGRPVRGAFGAVDVDRFRPAPPDPRVRSALGLRETDRVVGVVARVQPRRRFDLLLAATARLVREDPHARLLVLGRGTRLRETGQRPAERLGLDGRVIFAGHRGADYVDALRAMDVFTLLVPGSDGGCRALLEAAACGLPAVTSARGAIPEIVVHGETGVVVGEDADALCAAWRGLLADPERRRAMGQAARKRAENRFSRESYAAAVDSLYGALRTPSGR